MVLFCIILIKSLSHNDILNYEFYLIETTENIQLLDRYLHPVRLMLILYYIEIIFLSNF